MKDVTESAEIEAIRWVGEELQLLDQRLLPAEETYLNYSDAPAVAKAITDMVVRGAPAIGVTAAYAVVLSVKQHFSSCEDLSWQAEVVADIALLRASRPTAVNLMWALDRMQERLASAGQDPREELLKCAQQIHLSDRQANELMGQLAVDYIIDKEGREPRAFMTHCNAGALATGGYGTALGVLRSAWKAGILKHVYMDETRPWFQGARLTAWEMMKEGIPASLNVDGAAAHLLKHEDIAWVVVGADRISANGDVANKIGTYALSILAMHHAVGVMVVAPSSTIDMSLESGDEIPIEEREGDELLVVAGQQIGVEGCSTVNPVFDVTPAELIDVLVTEKGIVERPNRDKMDALMCRKKLH